MKKFKISVTKGQKKYTLVLKAENETEAKQRVHSEGYSILNLHEIWDEVEQWHAYSFVWIKDWEEKKGKVMGNEIFKVYIKLRKDLGYKIIELYSDEQEKPEQQELNKQVRNLEQEYQIYLETLRKTEKKQPKKEAADKIDRTKETNIDSFFVKKELEQTYKLIDFVLIKLQNLIDNKEIKDLDITQKEKLKTLYNSIIKIKKSTNIAKLKEVWELALYKIWLLELKELEKNKSDNMKVLLKDTNKLLKQIGSSKQFIEKDKDYKRILWEKFWEIFKNFSGWKKRKKIDKTSHEYIRTELLIRKYKEKLKQNTQEIIKNFFVTKKNKKDDLFLRRKVIKQNLVLYKVKQKWVNYSYTAIKKWYSYILEMIDKIITVIRQYIFAIIFFYTFFILAYIVLFPLISSNPVVLSQIQFNFQWLFYFIICIFIYITLYIRKWYISLGVNFVILFFIVIFWIINF